MDITKNVTRISSVISCLSVFFAVQPFASAEGLPQGSELQKVAQVTNDQNSQTDGLSVVTDTQGNPLGLYSALANGRDGEEQDSFFSLADLESPKGVVLDTEDGHNLFYLQGTIDLGTMSGDMTVKYLKNGLLNTYGSCIVKVARDSDGQWQMTNTYNGEVVTEIRAVTWQFGIKTLLNICP